MSKSKLIKVVRDDGVTELRRPEDEYRRGYEEACRLVKDDSYVFSIIFKLREDFYYQLLSRKD